MTRSAIFGLSLVSLRISTIDLLQDIQDNTESVVFSISRSMSVLRVSLTFSSLINCSGFGQRTDFIFREVNLEYPFRIYTHIRE